MAWYNRFVKSVEYAEKMEIILLVDASQSAGSIPVDVEDCNIDLLAFAGHKGLLGPLGVGGLYVGEMNPPGTRSLKGVPALLLNWSVNPKIYPKALRQVLEIHRQLSGLSAGVDFIENISVSAISSHKSALINRLKTGLKEVENIKIYHHDHVNSESCGVLSFTIDGWNIDDIGKVLNSQNFVVRGGLQCAPHAHRTLGTFPEGTIRVSPGYFNTERDIDSFLQSLKEVTVSKMFQI